MTLFRAILGRFARFLVRIARTLDPGAAAAPAVPLRMAALRQRYPGAPDHWLQLLARRSSIGEPPAETAYRTDSDADARHGRGAARPAPRFTAPAGSSRGVTTPPIAEPAPRRLRPTLAFGALRGRRSVADAPHGPGEAARRDMVRFADADPERRERRTVFTGSDQPALPEPSWPEFRFSAPPGPSWPGTPRAPRPDPRFATADHRWPELPALLDEIEGLELRASDEAALIAEQMGGKWSA